MFFVLYGDRINSGVSFFIHSNQFNGPEMGATGINDCNTSLAFWLGIDAESYTDCDSDVDASFWLGNNHEKN
jgi:hypothetical protein